MLYDPIRHEPLTATRWSEAEANAAIQRIVGDSVAQFDHSGLWPPHPLDDPRDEFPFYTPYSGAAGVILALQRLRDAGLAGDFPDFVPVIDGLLEGTRRSTSEGKGLPSLLLGECGILLQWQTSPSAALADAIHRTVERNLRNPTRESLLGSPGTLLAAILMH
ncbi:MAG TPA: hypothetical protein PLW68_10135 [Casimicrobiaceae bacterium]|nr:hypothetical protein [Casimicrobiaceae bacterium]